MRRLSIALAAALFATPALAQSISVPIDQSRRIALATGAADVAVGNPQVADVSVVDARNILVTGKGYGVTNVMALDAGGRVIFDRQVVVSGPDASRVSVYRGAKVQEYACQSRCEAAVTGQGGAAPAN